MNEEFGIQFDTKVIVQIVQAFTRRCASAEAYEDVFQAIADVLVDSLVLENCQIYEALTKKKRIFSVYERNGEIGTYPSIHFFQFGESTEGQVALKQKSKIEVGSDGDYQCKICTPIVFNGEILGVICSKSKNEKAFQESHLMVFELIAEISASLLVRIRQQVELDSLKIELERLLEDKKTALDMAIKTVSTQFSEIKFQRDKKEVLLREVHHRVNNNLQILSSMVRLYLNHDATNPDTLVEVHRRIQNLSSIHLILLKSLELNQISINGFLSDLSSTIRHNISDAYLIIDFITDESLQSLSMDTLVPLGMLVHEMVSFTAKSISKNGEAFKLLFKIHKEGDYYFFKIHLQTENTTSKETQSQLQDSVQEILIEALCDQIDGELLNTVSDELWCLKFKDTLAESV